jgi:S1-C subfamily serine protease
MYPPKSHDSDKVVLPHQYSPAGYENNNNSLVDGKVASILPSVELIRVESVYEEVDFKDKPLGKFRKLKWHGSGTVIAENDNNYFLLTAGHVALAEEKIETFFARYRLRKSEVFLAKTESKLELIAGELNNRMDYAYLKCRKSSTLDVMNAKVGDSDKIQVNDLVYAYGYPLATGNSVTKGIISCTYHQEPRSFDKSERYNEQFLFTSPISPGNSGGPVFAVKQGELYLVGITVASYVRGQNMNIAIKINDIVERIELARKK